MPLPTRSECKEEGEFVGLARALDALHAEDEKVNNARGLCNTSARLEAMGAVLKAWSCVRHRVPPDGSVTPDALIVAFVQGAKWWEHHKTGATMWASDQSKAEGHAEEMARNGTLGKSPNAALTRAGDNPT